MPRTRFDAISFESFLQLIKPKFISPLNHHSLEIEYSILRDPTLAPIDKLLIPILQVYLFSDYRISTKRLAEILQVDRRTLKRSMRRLRQRDRMIGGPDGPAPSKGERRTTGNKGLRRGPTYIYNNIYNNNNNNKKIYPEAHGEAQENKSKKSNSRRKKYIYDKRHLSLAKRFTRLQKANHPRRVSSDKASLYRAANTLRKLETIDGHNFEEEIVPAIIFATKDPFWSNVVLSLATLRKKSRSNEVDKFYNLLMAYKRSEEKNAPPPKVKQPLAHRLIIKEILTYLSDPPDQSRMNLLVDCLSKLEGVYNSFPQDIYDISMHFPSFDKFIKRYLEYMDDLSWLNDIQIFLFKPTSQIFKQFIKESEGYLNRSLKNGEFINR